MQLELFPQPVGPSVTDLRETIHKEMHVGISRLHEFLIQGNMDAARTEIIQLNSALWRAYVNSWPTYVACRKATD